MTSDDIDFLFQPILGLSESEFFQLLDNHGVRVFFDEKNTLTPEFFQFLESQGARVLDEGDKFVFFSKAEEADTRFKITKANFKKRFANRFDKQRF